MYRTNRQLPRIPMTERKEIPALETLITPEHLHDARPEMVKPYQNVAHPEMNRMYGSLRVEEGWQFLVDNYSNGGLTTVAGTQVSAAVKLLQNTDPRLSRWPGAVQLYLAIRSFAMVASTATFATLGSLDVYYQDTLGGQTIPLASVNNSDEIGLVGCNIIIPSPITDPGALAVNEQIGTILVSLSAGATVGTYVWQMAFAYAYLLPTMKPYDIQHVEELFDGHPGHDRKPHS